ncbi:MAG TPA: matrixin family metalloprotease [Chthoniobacterales bacterium]|nr:matrixin family metalloprotease [Chthoniobacterales bacterium]
MKISFLFLAAITAALASASFGYVREFDNGTPIAWVKDRTVVMQVSLGTGTRILRDGFTSFNDSAIDALKVWNQHLAHMQFSWVKNSPVTPAQGDDEMSVFFDTKVFGMNFGSGVLAVTLLSDRSGNFEETDTVVNSAISWDSYRGPLTPPVYDFHRVIMHEFGHTVGLDHPDQANPKQNVVALMNSHVSDLDTLAQDDINGATAIYGTGPAYNSIPNAPVLMDLSTRGTTFTGNNVLIGGFIVQGSQPAQLIVRCLAYSLASYGVSGALGDSVIELHDANRIIASNDDWFTSSDAATISSYHRDPPNSIESALLITLNPGNYTAIVRSYSDAQQPAQSGVALFEVYDLRKSSSRLGNVSTRGQVGTGDNILIGGIIIGGNTSKPVVIRALGPSLTKYGVTGVLADPYVELRDGNGTLVEANNDWQQSPEAATIIADGKAPSNAKEAAMAPTLNPGNYTALVSGVGGTTGTALVEVYDESPSP